MEMNKSTEALETQPKNVMPKTDTKKCYLLFSIFLCIAGIGSLTATAAILRTRNSAVNCPGQREQNRLVSCLTSNDQKLKALFTKVKTTYYKLYPTRVGFSQDLSPNFTPEIYRYKTEKAEELLKEVELLEASVLKGSVKTSVEGRHTLALFKYFLKNTFGEAYENNYKAGDWLMAPNIFCWQYSCGLTGNIHSLVTTLAPKSTKDVEKAIELMRKYDNAYRQRIKNLNYGIEVGIVPPKEACKAGIEYFKLLHYDVAKNGKKGILQLLSLSKDIFNNVLKQIDDKEKEEWLRSKNKTMFESLYESLINNVGKSLSDLIRYLDKEYIRHCPPSNVSSGYSSLPLPYVYTDGVADLSRPTNGSLPAGEEFVGKEAYKILLSFFTTYDITPKEIDNLATQRLHKTYRKVIELAKELTKENNETKAIEKFREIISKNKFYYTVENETNVNESYFKCRDEQTAKLNCPKRWKAMNEWRTSARSVLSRLRTKIPCAFYLTGKKRITPICPVKIDFDFNPTSAYYSYSEGNKDCNALAVVRIPFFLEKLGPKYEELTVLAHESYPGHHLEVQGVRENFEFKCEKMGGWVSKHNYFAAYSEGWATYIEKHVTDKDMGLYRNDNMSRYGMLKHQILAALKAKVDVGIHFMGMKRQEAIALYEKYSLDRGDVIEKEITRLQSAPGQGTSYMVGEAKLSELRKKVEESLEDKFDSRDFHYEILGSGPLPLVPLASKIDNYIAEQLKEKI